MEMQKLLTVDQTAEILQLNKDTVYKLLLSGVIPGRKFGKHWRIRLEDVISISHGETGSKTEFLGK